MINRQDITAALRSKKLVAGQGFEIQCDTVKAILYRDILELFLFVSGVKRWEWLDSRGGMASRQPLLKILANIFRDVLLWPFIYLNRSKVIVKLCKEANTQCEFGNNSSILFLRTDHWFNVKSGGSVGHLSGVIRGFRALGYRTYVVSTDWLAGVEKDVDFHLCEPVYEMGRNLPNMPELFYNDQIVGFIEERWEEWSASFIYQRYSLGNYSGVLLKHKHRVPYVCEYNGSFIWMARQWGGQKLFHEKLMARIELLNLEAADVVVVVSRPMKDELVARGIKADKILVNPNGVDPEQYSPSVDGSGVRSQYNLRGKTVIGFIGTFGPWHGAEVLAKAIRPSVVENDNLHFLFVGDGVRMDEVRSIIAKDGVSDFVTFTGLVPQSQAPRYLAACDILASPHISNPDGTLFFGSPTKLFEYMAMGKAIVASDLGQIGEILQHRETAWMVRPDCVTDLAQGILCLAQDAELRRLLGAKAREEVVARYTWERNVQRVLEACQRLQSRAG